MLCFCHLSCIYFGFIDFSFLSTVTVFIYKFINQNQKNAMLSYCFIHVLYFFLFIDTLRREMKLKFPTIIANVFIIFFFNCNLEQARSLASQINKWNAAAAAAHHDMQINLNKKKLQKYWGFSKIFDTFSYNFYSWSRFFPLIYLLASHIYKHIYVHI